MMSVEDHVDFGKLLLKGVFGAEAKLMRCNETRDSRTKKFPDNFPDTAKSVYREWISSKKIVKNGVEVKAHSPVEVEKLCSTFLRSLSVTAKNMDGVRGEAKVIKEAKETGVDVQAAVDAHRKQLEKEGEERVRKTAVKKGENVEAAVAAYKEQRKQREYDETVTESALPKKRKYTKRGSFPLRQKQLPASASTTPHELQPAVRAESTSTGYRATPLPIESWHGGTLDNLLPPGPSSSNSVLPIQEALNVVNNGGVSLIDV